MNTTVSGVSLDMFVLPQENMSNYFRYDGSLTTPDCDEAVVWTLFENPIFLSGEQVIIFTILYHEPTGGAGLHQLKYYT